MIRKDEQDVIYRTEKGKFAQVVDDIAERHEKGQPDLVGTVSVEKSELLSKLLKKRGIKHEVLNAKNHAREAEVYARCGRTAHLFARLHEQRGVRWSRRIRRVTDPRNGGRRCVRDRGTGQFG
ncbi:hypothetical protein ACFOEP_13220 [Microbacterium amylolyticum]|uniref:preprotein translocase subunit SecA n=1 Tax=Microbacterium amylolyticum TaxID=936337 RepID=UPI003618D6EA